MGRPAETSATMDDLLIWVEVPRLCREGRNVSAAARIVAGRLNKKPFRMTDADWRRIGTKIVKAVHDGRGMTREQVLHHAANWRRERRSWTWQAVRVRYYQLLDESSPHGRRLRELWDSFPST